MALNTIDRFFEFYENYPEAFASAPIYSTGDALSNTAEITFTLASNYVISSYTQDEVASTPVNDVGNPGGTYVIYCSPTETGVRNVTDGVDVGRGNASFTVSRRNSTGPAPEAFFARSQTLSTNRTVTVFDFTDAGGIDPNEFGELYFRLNFIANNGNNALKNFEVSEVLFFDENYDKNDTLNNNLQNSLISNIVNTEIFGSENFKDVKNVADGGTVYTDQFAPEPFQTEYLIDGVNYDSDRSDYSEARVVGTPTTAHIDFRVRGGTRSVNKIDRFIPSSEIDGGALVTDPTGFVAGIFEIPDPTVSGNPAFETGERQFRLTSNPNNQLTSVETFAQSKYTATGILETRQETFTATRNARVETREVTENIEVFRTRDLGEEVTGWWDPLAQSILPSAPGGEFITKVDVFFAEKDPIIPVTLQIREMENGIPTRRVIPGASKTLFPSQVKTSSIADQATTFVFDHPIYLKEDVEVALVLMTDSQKYLAWISRMGENDVSPNFSRNVSDQPYLGVLFKSQNNSTWTPYDYEDLKFTVYRALFNTQENGVVELENVDIPMKHLREDPLQTFAGSNLIKVFHKDHQMYSTTNKVLISGVTSGVATTLDDGIESTATGITFTLTDDTDFPIDGNTHTFLIKSQDQTEQEDEVLRGTVADVGGTYTVTITQRGVQGSISRHESGSVVELYELNGFTLDKINTVHDIQSANLDYYTIEIDGETATEDATIGGANVTASENSLVDAYQLMVPTLSFPDTNLDVSVQFVSGTSASGSQASFSTLPAEQAELIERTEFRSPRMIASKTNEDNNLAGTKSANVTFTMSSNRDNLSPVVDLERKSITTYANRIDSIDSENDVFPLDTYVSPTEPEGDSGESIYITKRVQLQNPATAIRVYVDVLRNIGAELELMYKVLRSDDSTDFDDISWTYFNENGNPDIEVPEVSDRFSFKEYQYTANNIPEFISFAIKIKMNGTNSSEPPLLKNLRAIALAV